MKVFRKILALFLVGVMSFNEFAPLVFALEELTENNPQNEISKTELEPKQETQILNEKFDSKGSIEVETHLVLPVRNTEDSDITIELISNDAVVASVNTKEFMNSIDYINKASDNGIRITASRKDKKGTLLTGYDSKNNFVYLAVNFYNLDKGTYTLKFSGKNFVTYTTQVTLENYSKRVELTNEKGLFTIGDVTNDNVVDNNDVQSMLVAIENNDLSKDLNLDGVVDIADLNYVTAGVVGQEGKLKVNDTSAIISSDNVSLNKSESTNITAGSLSNIFTEEGKVTLEKTSEEPIEVDLDLNGNNNNSMEMQQIRVNFGTENVPEEGYIEIEDINGEIKKLAIPNLNTPSDLYAFTEKGEGDRVIDLGGQVAVKKVRIVITKTGSTNLADIAKVEFLNNVKVEVQEPANLNVPKNVQVDTSVSEQVTVTFNDTSNVTGYEICIDGGDKKEVIFQTTFRKFTIEDLKNYVTYKIKVRSVNGEWKSKWSDEVEATPQATRVPPAVDMVKATGTFSGIDFSWKEMDDTRTYNLYYREVGTTEWLSIKEITETKYNLRNLKPKTEYEAYLTGTNELGEGSKSQHVSAKTLEKTATIYPKYRLINTYDEKLNRTSHIEDVIYKAGASYIQDEANNLTDGDKWSMVDDNYTTFWKHNSWQINSNYESMDAPIFILDKTYKMDEFVITVPDGYPYVFKTTSKADSMIYYWNKEDNKTKENRTIEYGKIISKKDENNRVYYVLKLDNPIEADAIQIGLTINNNKGNIQIAEFKIYEYDSLVDDVAALFKDDLRVELADGVNQDMIDKLRERADEKSNGEYNPYRESILNDLKYAEDILNDKKINDVITLNPNISNKLNSNLGFAMTINDYQPLGVAVRAGEQITIYVGSTSNVNIEAVFTQNYAEANAWSSTKKLNKGQNVITVPEIGDATSERGGSLYVHYTSTNNINTPVKIRVSGGTKIPMLDTTLTENDEAKTKEAIKNYIEDLDKYVDNLPTLYNEKYQNSEKKFSYTEENKRTSALGVTEIVTRHGLWSFSAEAVRDAIDYKLSDINDKVDRLYESTEAFDEMMEMFYRHKGLKENAEEAINEIPKSRINIRYMRMFDGAFMYAGGYHIGIEYGSIAGVIQGKKNTSSKTGYFGWGISHEIGHQINQGNIVYAEITNNVYSLLAQTANDKDESRLEGSKIYDKIYEKVTSHTLGRAQNVFVTLGMYWQLHLAYDNNKTFDDTDSIFARINKESRTFDNKEKKYSKDDLLILFASKAAGKDLTKYFETWGLVASDALKNEIKTLKLEEETKEIYYLNDAARRYRLSGKKGLTDTDILTASIKDKNDNKKRVTLTFNVSKEEDKILGYEILRNGESIAFVDSKTNEFTDNIGTVNNRAFTYEVVAYDYLLNKTNKVTLEEVKIEHDGSVEKDNFTIESNFKEANEKIDYEDENLDYSKLKVSNLIDNDVATGFNGTERVKSLTSEGVVQNSDDAYVIINLNTKLSLSGIAYRALAKDGELDSNTIKKYKISVSSDKVNWTEARVGEFTFDENNYVKVYFMKENTDSQTQLWTYDDISYIKIESVGNKKGISGAEFDVIAPPGDNINFNSEDADSTIGVLEKDYCYLTSGCKGDEGIIKAGSVVIEGKYAGSPSFNVVEITDAKDSEKIYDGYGLIFAEINSDLTVYEVSEGTWLYVMTEEEYTNMVNNSSSIRAILKRVSNAEDFSGERLTSTSKELGNLKPYKELSKITIKEKN